MTPLIQSVDWVAVAPPLITAVAGLAVLVADLFLPEKRKPVLGWASVAGLALAGLFLVPLAGGGRRSTFCLTEPTGLADVAGQCSYVVDRFTLVIQLLVLAGALITALMSISVIDETRLPAGEFWFLLLSTAAGAALLPAARDLATLVVALEVASLPAFALVGLRRGDRLSSEAALKFFLSSVTATAVMLFGVSLVYAATGSLHLEAVAEGLGSVDDRLAAAARVGVVLTLVGFAFKLAVVPFHFWVPDSYVGAPLPVAAYLSVVGKAAGFSGLILVTVIAFRPYHGMWGAVLAVLAAATMTTGNVAALRQRAADRYSAVRLLAWSSVAQAGYLLVPLAAAGYAVRGETATAAEMVGATVAYALMYTAVNLGAFAVAVLVGRAAPDNRITDYRSLFAGRPLAALALGFFLLCLAGLPPGVIGLFAKVAVFRTAVDAGLGWLAAVMAVNVVIGLYYYLRWTAILFTAGAAPETVPAGAGTARQTAPTGTAGPTTSPGAVTSARPGATEQDAAAPTAHTAAVAASAPVRDREPGKGPGRDQELDPDLDLDHDLDHRVDLELNRHRGAAVPFPLAAAIALTLALGIALSGAPQLALRFATGTLF